MMWYLRLESKYSQQQTKAIDVQNSKNTQADEVLDKQS